MEEVLNKILQLPVQVNTRRKVEITQLRAYRNIRLAIRCTRVKVQSSITQMQWLRKLGRHSRSSHRASKEICSTTRDKATSHLITKLNFQIRKLKMKWFLQLKLEWVYWMMMRTTKMMMKTQRGKNGNMNHMMKILEMTLMIYMKAAELAMPLKRRI